MSQRGNPGAFPKVEPIFQQPFSLPENAQTLARIASGAAGKSREEFSSSVEICRKNFSSKEFQTATAFLSFLKGGWFDQETIVKIHLVVCVVSVVPSKHWNLKSFERGLFSNSHLTVLVVSAVLVVSSVQKRVAPFLDNPLPALRFVPHALQNGLQELAVHAAC